MYLSKKTKCEGIKTIIVYGGIHEKVFVVLMATVVAISVMKGFGSDGSGRGQLHGS